MVTCKVCGQEKSAYILNNKTVCMRCDELTFDIEIELEETAQASQGQETARTIPVTRTFDKKAT